MDITLNLASPETLKRRRLFHLAVGGLSLSVLLGFGNLFLYRSSQADLRIAEQRIREAQEAIQKREHALATVPGRLPSAEMARLDARVKLYNHIIEGANFSWSGLLFELERAIPPNVALDEIQPVFGEGGVTLVGTARSMEDLLRCVQHLKEREAFHQVYLRDHAVKEKEATVRFKISLRYRGEAA
ncbi:MAG: PilN domain-containing protein [Candidatus Methylomirabilales bacterium]